MSTKRIAATILRKVGLFEVADAARGHVYTLKTATARREFELRHPDFVLPPPDLAYDAYSRWTPDGYRKTGLAQAEFMATLIREHRPGARAVAEWGCGPMRILRHMPGLLPRAKIIGLDYNPDTIAWAQKQPEFAGIDLRRNDLHPPLPMAEGEVDAIFNISVFTHLSEVMHYAYMADLMRCLSPGGILISTMQGDWYRRKLTPAEMELYDRGEIVVRDGVTEGKRGYSAFHPPQFVARLLRGMEVIDHIVAPDVPGLFMDVWVARKRE